MSERVGGYKGDPPVGYQEPRPGGYPLSFAEPKPGSYRGYAEPKPGV